MTRVAPEEAAAVKGPEDKAAACGNSLAVQIVGFVVVGCITAIVSAATAKDKSGGGGGGGGGGNGTSL